MIISILIAKFVAFVLHIFGKGATTLPGKIALGIKYNILNKLSSGVSIVCVTGTNGKTTTCALIEQGIASVGKSYFINKSGANMLSGVATAFILNSSIFGNCKKDYAILECDENSLPIISRYLDANVVVVTNVFRDQLDRYGEVHTTLSKIKQGILNMPSATLVLNADCPITYSLSTIGNNVVTFGVNANGNNTCAMDNLFCPICNNKLVYSSITMAHLGTYKCTKCGYCRKMPNIFASDIINTNDSGNRFFINNNLVSISLGGLYNIYNFCAAVATLKLIGIKDYSTLCSFSGAFGRMERFNCNGNSVLLLLAKNPVGMLSCINYSILQPKCNYVFALNDNSADGRDVSWIWDCNFTPVCYKYNAVYTIGTRSYDMALRLKYDGIVPSIIDGENYNKLVNTIKLADCDTVVISNYTAMMNMRHYFINAFGGAEFWK